MKRIISLLSAAMLAAVMLLTGCGSGSAGTLPPDAKLTGITIEYNISDDVHRRVKIDLVSGEKETVDYSAETSRHSEAFSGCSQLEEYIISDVLPALEKGSYAKSGSGSEELLLWNLKIHTDADTIVAYGTESEGYPVFWEALLLWAGE